MQTVKPRNLVLLSGGLDSLLVLYLAMAEGPAVALSVDYGQPHAVELASAQEIAKTFGVEWIKASVRNMPGMDESRAHYCPGRNSILLSLAASWAEQIDARFIWFGPNANDFRDYPDCRPAFVEAWNEMLLPFGLEIRAPLIHKTKREIVADITRLDLPFYKTTTCYEAEEVGAECGACPSCQLRKAAFDALPR